MSLFRSGGRREKLPLTQCGSVVLSPRRKDLSSEGFAAQSCAPYMSGAACVLHFCALREPSLPLYVFGVHF